MHDSELKNFKTDSYYFKFGGVLSEVNLDLIDDDVIRVLLKNNIYVPYEEFTFNDLDIVFRIENYPNKDNSTCLDEIIYYNSQKYTINPEVTAEIFCLIQSYIVCSNNDTEYYLEKIFFKVKSIIGKKEKINYLKKQYKKQFPKDLDFECYSNINNDEGCMFGVSSCWYEFIYDYLFSETELFLIKTYLTAYTYKDSFEVSLFDELIISTLNKEDEENECELGELLNKWRFFSQKEFILKDILWKIEEIKEPKTSAENIPKPIEFKLQDLFDKREKYSSFLAKLAQEEIVQISDDYIKIIIDEPNLEPIRLVCCIGYLLYTKGCFKTKMDNNKVTQKMLVNTLTNTFGITISEQAYSAAKKDFHTAKNSKNYAANDYLDKLHFI